jgi:hypothetical protein
MAQRAAELSDELDLLFTDGVWAERAEAGLDDDGPENPQALIGEAADELTRVVAILGRGRKGSGT